MKTLPLTTQTKPVFDGKSLLGKACFMRLSEHQQVSWPLTVKAVTLSRQALDIFVALHTCAAGSKFVLPSRYDSDRCMSHATLNRGTQCRSGPTWSMLGSTGRPTCPG